MYNGRGVQLTARDRAIAAWLWSGKNAVVSGTSAATLFGAKWIDADTPAELISSRTRPPPLIVTRNETLAPDEQTRLAGIPATTPARTAFDLGRRSSLLLAVQRLDALARATGVTARDVTPLMRTHPGLRGMKQLRRALPLMNPCAESREWCVGVEFDGAQHWTDPLQRSNNIDRAAELARLGWVVVRVSYDLLRNRPAVVIERVRQALRDGGCPQI